MSTNELPASLRPERLPLVGMVHLPPLPGAPGAGAADEAMHHALERALADARTLRSGGVDALLVENYADAPFFPERVPAWTVAAMARVVAAVRREAPDLPVGVNVLRNDAVAAVGVAAATGASFVRVNVHTGSAWTDQGLLHGSAHETLRLRDALGARVWVAADVHVKHAVPPYGTTLEESARDLVERGRAEVVIVSGPRTGTATEADRVSRVVAAVPGTPVWIGSGLDADNAEALLGREDGAHGAIVGSALHRDGVAGRGIERGRVERLAEAFNRARVRRRNG